MCEEKPLTADGTEILGRSGVADRKKPENTEQTPAAGK